MSVRPLSGVPLARRALDREKGLNTPGAADQAWFNELILIDGARNLTT